MLRKIAQKILILFYDRPLSSPTESELKLIEDLKASFCELKSLGSKIEKESELEWLKYMNRLKELVQTGNPREFLRWDVIRGTMFVEHSRYIPLELEFLKSQPDWESRWEAAINESNVGRPLPYAFHPKSSGNLIHQAYHLAIFEKKIHRLDDVNLVVEFGGGYGSMCRLFSNIGFKGRYIIFDLEPFSLLQQYYLKSLGIPVLTLENFKSSESGVLLLSDISILRNILDEYNELERALFLATWSISETPVDVRESFLPLVSGFGSFLLAYQSSFGEVDNIHYFDTWQKDMPNISWSNYQISQIPGSHYLMGHVVSQ